MISRGAALYCAVGTDIRERDRFLWNGSTYSVKSVLTYGNVIRAEAEQLEC